MAIDRCLHHVSDPRGTRSFRYVEKASYYFVAQRYHQSMRTQVRVEFDSTWNLVFLHQFKALR